MKEVDKIALALLPSQMDAASMAIGMGMVEEVKDEEIVEGAYELAEAYIKVRDWRNNEQKDMGLNS